MSSPNEELGLVDTATEGGREGEGGRKGGKGNESKEPHRGVV